MNLSAILVDPTKLHGIWWDFITKAPVPGNAPHKEDPCFRIVPHGAAFEATLQELMEPYIAARLRGRDVPADELRVLRAKALAQATLIDWANIEMGTPPKPVPYSREQAIEFLSDPKWELLRRFVENAFRHEAALLADAERSAEGN